MQKIVDDGHLRDDVAIRVSFQTGLDLLWQKPSEKVLNRLEIAIPYDQLFHFSFDILKKFKKVILLDSLNPQQKAPTIEKSLLFTNISESQISESLTYKQCVDIVTPKADLSNVVSVSDVPFDQVELLTKHCKNLRSISIRDLPSGTNCKLVAEKIQNLIDNCTIPSHTDLLLSLETWEKLKLFLSPTTCRRLTVVLSQNALPSSLSPDFFAKGLIV